jgi:hypothetical protein
MTDPQNSSITEPVNQELEADALDEVSGGSYSVPWNMTSL